MRSKRRADTVVVVGAGLSGIATAISAAMHGLDVVVIGHAHPEYLDEAAMKRWLAVSPVAIRHWEDVGAIRWAVIPGLADYHNEAPGAQPAGRYLTNERIDGSILGEWRAKLRVSPYFPVGTTCAEMFEKGRRLTQVDDEEASGETASVQGFGMPENRDNAARPAAVKDDPLTFGTGVVGSFLAKALHYPNIRSQRPPRASANTRCRARIRISAAARWTTCGVLPATPSTSPTRCLAR